MYPKEAHMKLASLLLAAFAAVAVSMIATATSSSAESNYERCMARCQLATPHCNKRCIKR